MFQTYEVTSTPAKGPARLDAVRAELGQMELDGFLVPRADRFQGEYVAPCDERLAWLTGFTGSAGFACVLPHIAGVFIDGRYRVQVRSQVAQVFTPVHWPETQLADWLCKELPNGGTIGYDPWLHTVAQIRDLGNSLSGSGITLAPIKNPIDAVWDDRPPPPRAPIKIHPDSLAGEPSAQKRARLAEGLDGVDCTFIALPDSVCWLLNLRGADIPRNPVFQSCALLYADGTVDLFTNAPADDSVLAHIGSHVTLHPLSDLETRLGALTNLCIQIDPASTPNALNDLLANGHGIAVSHGQDPCSLPKARKNDIEISGTREAHLRDGAAMVRFLAWLDATAPKGNLTEIDVATRLESFRRDTNALQDISFETICGSGPNGAIVHYRVNETTNRPVQDGELLLVDSGGQYLDGTTDITRTIAIGSAGLTERRCYTRVLQGMIAISRLRFPTGIAGSHLDAIARYPLWLDGLDYDHGTGHGVGAYLSVHEGPQGLSRRASTVLEPGMVLSNEPGYYREGAFGIRIENLIVTKPAVTIPAGDPRDMLDFETLTYVPFDRKLIEVELLTTDERAWIDQYHSATLASIGPRVDGAALDWLTAACAPLN